ncbi:hypothetical protein C0991_011811 [Blastosporella zonata]|nr:hypothetical protein C0991_011811 [Blastosporella zonata]
MTAFFSRYFEGPSSRNEETMEMVSLVLKAKAKARAAWALFQVDDLESSSPKVTKWAGGHVGVNQNPSFRKTMADRVGSHPTCTNRGAVCKDKNGGSAQKPAPTKGRFCPYVSSALELKDEGEVPEDKWTRLAGQLQSAQAEVAEMSYLHHLARLELLDLEAKLDAGVADVKEDKKEEDQEAKMAARDQTLEVGWRKKKRKERKRRLKGPRGTKKKRERRPKG